MLFILLVVSLVNLLNFIYAIGVYFHWYSQAFINYYSLVPGLGDVGVSVIATLLAVILATVILYRFKNMSGYEQQFERGSMRFSIICCLLNVWIAAILMFMEPLNNSSVNCQRPKNKKSVFCFSHKISYFR